MLKNLNILKNQQYIIHIHQYVISIPVFNFGADLSNDLSDTFYNSEKLIPAIGYIDGITVVYVLNALKEYLNMTP